MRKEEEREKRRIEGKRKLTGLRGSTKVPERGKYWYSIVALFQYVQLGTGTSQQFFGLRSGLTDGGGIA